MGSSQLKVILTWCGGLAYPAGPLGLLSPSLAPASPTLHVVKSSCPRTFACTLPLASSSDSSAGSHFPCPLLTQALCATPPRHLLSTQGLGHHSTCLFLQFQPLLMTLSKARQRSACGFCTVSSVQEQGWPTGKEGSLRKIPVGRFPSALSGLFFTCRAHVLIGWQQTPTRAGETCTDRPPVPWTLWALTWATAIASTTRWRPWSSFADSPSLALPGSGPEGQFSASTSSSTRWGSFQNWTFGF